MQARKEGIVKTSTGRSSSAKHLTGNNDGKTFGTRNLDRASRRPRTSTGEKAAIAHFTGRLFDLKRERDVQEEKSTKQKRPQAA
jgi:hypothetical protein